MKIHYLVVGLSRNDYKIVLEHLDNIFKRYEIIYYFMNDESENDFYDIKILGNRNYHIIDYNIDTFKEYIKKYGHLKKYKFSHNLRKYKYKNADIQFYKVMVMFNNIKNYNEGDIIIRGRSDFVPIFNDSGLNDKNNPEKGWKYFKKPDIIIDNINLDNYDMSYLYYIGYDYKKHPYNYIFDGWFMSNYSNMKKLVYCGIMYNNQYYDSWNYLFISLWNNGNPPEAQLLRNLLNNNVKLKTVSDKSSCIYFRTKQHSSPNLEHVHENVKHCRFPSQETCYRNTFWTPDPLPPTLKIRGPLKLRPGYSLKK